MAEDNGSKSEGEHLALRGLMCAMLAGASRRDGSDELDGGRLIVSTDTATPNQSSINAVHAHASSIRTSPIGLELLNLLLELGLENSQRIHERMKDDRKELKEIRT